MVVSRACATARSSAFAHLAPTCVTSPFRIRRSRDRKSTRLNSSHRTISYAVFCLNPPAPSPTYTLSLHDALPISVPDYATATGESLKGVVIGRPKEYFPAELDGRIARLCDRAFERFRSLGADVRDVSLPHTSLARSEEHTSELQSPYDLVCRLLLEPSRPLPDLHSFPTRRSSDLRARLRDGHRRVIERCGDRAAEGVFPGRAGWSYRALVRPRVRALSLTWRRRA